MNVFIYRTNDGMLTTLRPTGRYEGMSMKRIVIAGAVALGTGLAAVAVAGTSNAATSAQGTDAFAVTSATKAVAAHPAEFAATGSDAFTVRATQVDPNGDAHVRYDRKHKGLEVIGGDIVVHLDKAGAFTAASQPMAAALSMSTTPKISAAQAVQVAAGAFRGTGAPSTPKLAINAIDGTRLVWKTVVPGVADADGGAGPMNVLVDAVTGTVQGSYPDNQTASGNGFHTGTVPLDTTQVRHDLPAQGPGPRQPAATTSTTAPAPARCSPTPTTCGATAR